MMTSLRQILQISEQEDMILHAYLEVMEREVRIAVREKAMLVYLEWLRMGMPSENRPVMHNVTFKFWQHVIEQTYRALMYAPLLIEFAIIRCLEVGLQSWTFTMALMDAVNVCQ